MSELTNNLMKQLHFISKASNNFMYQHKQRLTGQQRVLAILRLEDGLSQSYLADVLDLRPSSIAELLKKLENSNYITRKEDEKDKRNKLVYLTDDGRKKADTNAEAKNEDVNDDFFAGLNDDEKQQFGNYLQKISDGWSDEFKQKSSRFVDPMDRMKDMQKVHAAMMEKFGDDWENMSPDEMRKVMHKAMRGKDFCGPHGGFMPEHGRNFRHDFRNKHEFY
ncbi:transcriptional regulator [Companilactobacillus tucceti DSM 20183]|uniref:Transcriptional regulator n=1 Tax=Companilactobacillus tucceti DSM 20183 TaxID=1423811 RepID=A0A0R1IY89_9LACO|nr:MarR family transcriptional regulator [Companilactobacillus tucceti]KRK64174.1 transcriptional regulator [Companilactobacillus tucceti DSM 20183]